MEKDLFEFMSKMYGEMQTAIYNFIYSFSITLETDMIVYAIKFDILNISYLMVFKKD